MSNWKKIQLTDHDSELKTLRLSGTTSGGMQPNPSYDPTGSNLHLHDFAGDTDDYLTTGSNIFPDGTGTWTSTSSFIFGGPDTIDNIENSQGFVQHTPFYPSYQAPGYSTPSSNTGPDHGITPSTSSTAKNVAQSADSLYLYAETSDASESVHSIISPELDLSSYTSKKLVFYFHMFGENCGRFRVLHKSSLDSLSGAIQLLIKYSNWPGENGSIPLEGGLEESSYWSGGSQNPSDFVIVVGEPGQIQVSGSSPFNRVEVDLETMTFPSRIWIVYESGNPDLDNPSNQYKADFAIGNLYLELDGYTIPAEIPNIAAVPTLKLNYPGTSDGDIRLLNLPESNPGIAGALYKHVDPEIGPLGQSVIMISTGSL